jgi:serine/threonine-protein kinase
MGEIERADLYGVDLDGRYRLSRPLGIGGTSVVFDAMRLSDGANVVVVLRDAFAFHAEPNRRLRREAEVARMVAHPGIARVLTRHVRGRHCSSCSSAEGECPRVPPRGFAAAHFVAAIVARGRDPTPRSHGYVHWDIGPASC